MTISLTTRMANNNFLFSQTAGQNGSQFTQLHIDLINSNPVALAFYESAAATNTPVVIGQAGEGTFYGIPPGSNAVALVIDANDFSHVSTPVGSSAQTAAQNQLSNAANVVLRGVHEAAHAQDNNDGTPIPGVSAVYATPGDYAVARAPTEGQSVAAEGRADHFYIGQTFTINGISVTYDSNTYVAGGSTDMDSRLGAIYSDSSQTSAQQINLATTIATAANFTTTASTSGSTYLDTNMRDYAAHWSGLSTDQISSVAQDNSGHWSVTANVGSGSITRSYDPIAAGQTAPTITSERIITSDNEGFTLVQTTNFQTRVDTREVFDVGNNIVQSIRTENTGVGGKVATTSEYTPGVAAPTQVTTTQDTNGDGTVDLTTTKVDADHNGTAETTTTAVTGGDTTVSADANQNGSAETVTITHANAQKDVTQTDEGSATWSVLQTHYDAQGRLDNQVIYNDDASSYFSDWDQANASATALSTTYYDAQARLDSQTITNDNGSYTVNDWDQTNVNGWGRLEVDLDESKAARLSIKLTGSPNRNCATSYEINSKTSVANGLAPTRMPMPEAAWAYGCV